MRVLVISDVHGNFEALKSVIHESSALKWTEIWFLGDLGGYGPQPQECFDLLRQYKTAMLTGNHDLYLTGRLEGSFFSDDTIHALISGRGFLNPMTLDILRDLPDHQRRKGITLVHGSPIKPATDYILNEADAYQCFSAFKGNCCLFGHTHVQGYYELSELTVKGRKPEPGEIIYYKNSRILVNPGSIGQPRDNDPRAAWCLLDTKKKEVHFHRTEYDIQKTQEAMEARKLSSFMIERLEKGI